MEKKSIKKTVPPSGRTVLMNAGRVQETQFSQMDADGKKKPKKPKRRALLNRAALLKAWEEDAAWAIPRRESD